MPSSSSLFRTLNVLSILYRGTPCKQLILHTTKIIVNRREKSSFFLPISHKNAVIDHLIQKENKKFPPFYLISLYAFWQKKKTPNIFLFVYFVNSTNILNG